MDNDTRTMQQLAANVLQAQDACNLSGVVISFSNDIQRLRRLMQEGPSSDFSTDKLNRHPICCMWSSKIASLTSSEGDFGPYYQEVVRLAQGSK